MSSGLFFRKKMDEFSGFGDAEDLLWYEVVVARGTDIHQVYCTILLNRILAHPKILISVRGG